MRRKHDQAPCDDISKKCCEFNKLQQTHRVREGQLEITLTGNKLYATNAIEPETFF